MPGLLVALVGSNVGQRLQRVSLAKKNVAIESFVRQKRVSLVHLQHFHVQGRPCITVSPIGSWH